MKTAIQIDRAAGIIRAVSVMTLGEAKGHGLIVDDTTLGQLLSLARAMKKVPVKEDHGTGVANVTGHLLNFRREGDRVIADWRLLRSYPNREQIMDTAEEQPETVGLSASFVSAEALQSPKSGNGLTPARIQELLSVDYVLSPASNPSGLFSARVNGQLVNFSSCSKAQQPHGRPGCTSPGRGGHFGVLMPRGAPVANGIVTGAPTHFTAIQQAVEFVLGPATRPQRATPDNMPTASTSRPARDRGTGQFKPGAASDPEKMRLAYQRFREHRSNRLLARRTPPIK